MENRGWTTLRNDSRQRASRACVSHRRLLCGPAGRTHPVPWTRMCSSRETARHPDRTGSEVRKKLSPGIIMGNIFTAISAETEHTALSLRKLQEVICYSPQIWTALSFHPSPLGSCDLWCAYGRIIKTAHELCSLDTLNIQATVIHKAHS